MGRNRRHKKELRLEKSKTQLKTKLNKTKFLPKGGNVTDVNFKIRPIILRDQLKTNDADVLVTRKKHSLKDLLTRTNHYNVTMRLEACDGLIEWLLASPVEPVEQSLYIILQDVCKFILDVEAKVRQKAIKLFHVLLGKVSHIKTIPFYNLLVPYVLCAMTHINKAIQEDSLLIIDVYLEHVPDLIVINFDNFFSNFLTLISKLRSDSNLSRIVTINLGSKLTSIKWRIKVLNRLYGILDVMNQKRTKTLTIASDTCKVIKCEGVNHIPMYRSVRSAIDHKLERNAALDSKNEAEYVKVLLPLLYDTWVEAVPLDEIKYRENGAMLIDQDAASVLTYIVGILYALLNFVKSYSSEANVRKLMLSHENKLLKYFLKQFPYRQHDYRKKADKGLIKLLNINEDPKCVQENLTICYLFFTLYKKLPNCFYRQRAVELLKYINVCLSQRNYVPPQSVKTLVLVLRVLYFDNFNEWQNESLLSDKLLDSIVNYHNSLPFKSPQRMEMFQLLFDIAKEHQSINSEKFTTWLSNLPQLLLKPEVPLKFIDTLSLLARQNNTVFLEAVVKALPDILENLPKIKVEDDVLPPSHIKIINIFCYIPNLHWRHIELLEAFVERNGSWAYVDHIKFLLLRKCAC